MCRRCIRALLVVIGSALLFFAAFPVMAFLHFEDSLQTELIASKLLLMPIGAICLAVATVMSRDSVRR